jgi:hypothetical protein
MKLKPLKAALSILFLALIFSSPVMAATVKMKTLVVNPSTTKSQTKSVKTYLPKEIKLKNILDAGGLEIDYDEDKELFFVFKDDIALAPGETVAYELTLEDVWMVDEKKLERLKNRAEDILVQLEDTPYYSQAELIAKTIFGRLEEIKKTQNDPNVTKQQHIAYYRDNMQVLDAVMVDLEELEKILVAIGGAPNLKVIEDSDVDLKSPNSKTTWIIIFSILIFIAILGGAFYFTWQGQVKVTENIFMKEKDLSFSEFKSPLADEADKKPK